MGEKIKNVILGILIVIGLSIEIIKIMPNPVFAYEKNIEKGLDKAIGKVRKYKTGDVVIPFKYDWIYSEEEGMFVVGIGDKYSLLNGKGEKITDIKYREVGKFKGGRARVGKYENGEMKYGYIDRNGKEIVPIKYDDGADFSEGLACVEVGGKIGFIDKRGKEVIKIKYKYWHCYNEVADYTPISNFRCGLACVIIGNKWGYINKKGKVVIPAKYDKAYRFSENRAFVCIGDKYGYIDKKGNIIGSLKYDYTVFDLDFREGCAKVYKARQTSFDGEFGIINKNGKEIVTIGKYDELGYFSEGRALVKKGEKYGYVNNKGKLVIPLKYDAASDFRENLALVQIGNKMGYINKNGKIVIPLKYDYASDFRDNLAWVRLGNKMGYINKKGKLKISAKFDETDDF